MMFVNQIADIVHSQVNKYGGSANKNMGEAFLIVWKFKDDDIKWKGNTVRLRKGSTSKSVTADFAVFSFLKVIAKINKIDTICDYKED